MDEVKKAAELTGLDDAIMSLPDGYDTNVPQISSHRDSGSFCQ